MSSCSLSYYLGGVFDRAATILCCSDAVTDPVTGRIISALRIDRGGRWGGLISIFRVLVLGVLYGP